MRVHVRTWFSFVILLSFLFIAASRVGVFDPLDNAVLSITAPVESGLRAATRPLADLVNNVTNSGGLRSENQSLREENERLKAQVARLTGAQNELDQLRQLLTIRGSRPGDNFVAAHVFAREPSNVKDVIAIDTGRSDGVQEGMIVLTKQGSFIGTVTRALDGVAWVTLVSDPSSAVSATVQESGVQGVVSGSLDGTMTMDFVAATADVKEGDLVITSGLGGRYPPGEIVGQVTHVQQKAQDLFQSVRVQPLADLSRLQDLLVLTSFLPKQSGSP